MHGVMRSHPEVSGFANTRVPEDEGQHLQTVYPIGMMFGGPGRFGFDPRAYMDENHPLATPASAAMLTAQWGRHWDFFKPVLIEKSPLNLIRTRFLQALFPTARFILILRRPIAVAYATRKYCNSPIPTLIEHGLRCYEIARADMLHLRHVHVMHYEDLVADPQSTLDNITRFAGITALCVEGEPIRDINDRYFAEWQSEQADVTAEAAKQEPGWLTRTAVRCLAFGYSLNTPEPCAQANFEITSSA